MYRIKKYPNGRLYDTTERKYLTPDLLSEHIKDGAEILVIDTETGEDITSEIIDRLLCEKKIGVEKSSGFMFRRIGKSRAALSGRIGRYFSLWRRPFSVDGNETEDDTFGTIGNWVRTFPDTFKRRIVATIDRKLDTVLGAINIATQNQVADLADKISELDKKIALMENWQTENASHEIAYSVLSEPIEKQLHA